MIYIRSILIVCLATLFSSQHAYANTDDARFIKFHTAELNTGRLIWIENCKGCHAYGTAGAPVPMIADEWRSRVSKPSPVLYEHAINGFFGPDDTMMPKRGGNPELSDQQVKLAVDYMITLAKYYIDQTSTKP